MAAVITEYKVFIASPRGLEEERTAFYDEVTDYDAIEARRLGVGFKGVGSETTMPGCGRPQSLINKELYGCDYYILALWDRWGSPPDEPGKTPYTSGSEEEFHEAMKCKADNRPMRNVVVMFKRVDGKRWGKPDEELEKVKVFKEKLKEERVLLFREFKDAKGFRKAVRGCLSKWAWEHYSRVAATPSEKTVLDYERPEENE